MAKKKQKQSPLLLLVVALIGLGVGLTVYMVSQAKPMDTRSQAAKPTLPPNFIKFNDDITQLKLGDKVTFTTESYGLQGTEYPLVYFSCIQGTEKVFGHLDHPDATFILGGGSSQWWLNGGPAICKATLYSYGGKTRGGYDEIRKLAETEEFPTY
jgi:hypothetical protein